MLDCQTCSKHGSREVAPHVAEQHALQQPHWQCGQWWQLDDGCHLAGGCVKRLDVLRIVHILQHRFWRFTRFPCLQTVPVVWSWPQER